MTTLIEIIQLSLTIFDLWSHFHLWVVEWMDILTFFLTFYLNHLSPLQGYFFYPEQEMRITSDVPKKTYVQLKSDAQKRHTYKWTHVGWKQTRHPYNKYLFGKWLSKWTKNFFLEIYYEIEHKISFSKITMNSETEQKLSFPKLWKSL